MPRGSGEANDSPSVAFAIRSSTSVLARSPKAIVMTCTGRSGSLRLSSSDSSWSSEMLSASSFSPSVRMTAVLTSPGR
jgi:hypothetical protein